MREESPQKNANAPVVDIDLLDYLKVLVKNRWIFARNFTLACLCAAAVSFILPKKYTAVATILPPLEEGRYELQSLLPDISMTALGLSDPSSPSALFVEILGSRAVREAVLRRFYAFAGERRTLLEVFDTSSIEIGLRNLNYCTTVFSSEQGIISIKVELPDPELAAAVANALVEELDRINQEKNISRAKNSRMYIEEQLELTERKLQEANEALTEFQEKNKAISLEEQTKAAIESAGELKGEIIAKQVELGTLKLSKTADNPLVIRTQRELDEMQKRYDELQYGNHVSLEQQKEIYIPIAQLPIVGRQFAELIREAKAQEIVWGLLNQQYYQAKIQEARDTPTVQQLDIAVPPEFRSKPKRKMIVIVAGLLSLAFTLFWVFGAEYYRQVQAKNGKLDSTLRYFRDDLKKAKNFLRRK